ncbi:hypothetical protein I3F58_22950 [Streptomyces sp. MUM 203J]|uniref:hypothetical protein n=1 Tax=Streptomyces sp. MUM 203J TaxID=2791990 RepID=UPI001F03F6F9|nr:hypothetical protein [Streptomyces sp. MUM 203J]MCH0542357.1 hypothetical protein [Streptomyces sp. MUM 203J]
MGKDLDLPPPDVQPGYRVLVSKGPVRGPASLGDVRLNKGITWVNVNCVADSGTRTITLDIETVGTFTLECTDRGIGNNVNQLDLAEGRSGRFRVTTTQDVRWAADIQVPE